MNGDPLGGAGDLLGSVSLEADDIGAPVALIIDEVQRP